MLFYLCSLAFGPVQTVHIWICFCLLCAVLMDPFAMCVCRLLCEPAPGKVSWMAPLFPGFNEYAYENFSVLMCVCVHTGVCMCVCVSVSVHLNTQSHFMGKQRGQRIGLQTPEKTSPNSLQWLDPWCTYKAHDFTLEPHSNTYLIIRNFC